jgi:S-DNA-T family DNA segregation ATPase FtsK/SpoIIIE
MEQRGIVGPYDGRNPRKILISNEEYLNKYDR